MSDVYQNMQDMTEETTGTLDGNESFVMFDTNEAKKAKLSTIYNYIGTNLVDNTLSTAGKAADAKAVGDAVNSLGLSVVDGAINVTFTV